MLPVKANAYGHGLLEVANVSSKHGVDWFGVDSVEEAELLRRNRINSPLLILGYIRLAQLSRAVHLNETRIGVYNKETIKKLGGLRKKILIHLKLETGTARQGVAPEKVMEFLHLIKKYPLIKIEGLYTHFANIEDTNNHQFALKQLSVFNYVVKQLENSGLKINYKHTACSAATILYKKTHFNLVRPGVGVYGLWSSPVTLLAARKVKQQINLKPVLSWKTVIAQIKEVKKNESVGYGRAEKVLRDSRVAIIPVGYFDGFDRGLSCLGHILIKGQRAKVIGRVCMNMFMVDVTDIKNLELEDEVVLLGGQGREEIKADEIAEKLGTINYEVVSRINPQIKRVVIR